MNCPYITAPDTDTHTKKQTLKFWVEVSVLKPSQSLSTKNNIEKPVLKPRNLNVITPGIFNWKAWKDFKASKN